MSDRYLFRGNRLKQLDKLKRWKKPRTIFIQSMGDLFHNEVPDGWIEEVFKACEAAPWHRYLFLTKNPHRYEALDKKDNLPKTHKFWYGTTFINKDDEAFYSLERYKTFLSIEPLHEDVFSNGLHIPGIRWVIIGAETGNRKGKIIPKREWIENIVNACKEANIPVFLKNNLAGVWGEPLPQEFPWEVQHENFEIRA